jgi:superfamily II RNA helicase
METAAGLQPSLKRFDEGMSPAIFEYALGRDFEELGSYTSAAGGDFVRIARMTVQYLRHLRKVCLQGELEGLAQSLDEAVSLLYRGPVDVRAELGLKEKDQPE